MSITPQLGIPLVPEGTIDPAAGLNIALNDLDALASAGVVAVLSMALTAPPGSPDDGDQYIVATGGTGAWEGLETHLVRYVDEGDFWQDWAPGARFHLVLDLSSGSMYRWNGSAYVGFGGGGGSLSVSDGTTTVAAASALQVSQGARVVDEGGGTAGLRVAAQVIELSGTSYDLGDLTPGAWHVFTAAGAVTLTVEDDDVEPVATDSEFGIEARGTGGLLLVSDDSAVIYPPRGGTLELAEGDFVVLKRTAEDVYKVIGSTVEAGS